MKKIIIAGGGTAGWLTALYLSKKVPNKYDITVIESSKLGIIGVGEGGTNILGDLIRNVDCDFGIDGESFTKETDAAMKMGIHHINWHKRDHSYKAPLDFSPTHTSDVDYFFLHALENDKPFNLATKLGWFWETNHIPYSKDRDTKNSDYYTSEGHSYHFNTYLLGQFFKNNVLKNGVKYIDAIIKNVNVTDDGIESLVLDNGQIVHGDLFVDCTGFSKSLITKLDSKWVSYADHLPINRAMAFYLPVERGTDIPLWTIAHAMSSGWMWKIPTLGRFGCGYVFCNKYLTDKQAQEEIERELGQKIEPYKFIDFESGRFENGWNKNCVALGLAYSFVEPLEATSIHSTILQIKNVTSVLADEITVDEYNDRASKMLDAIKDFISTHYSGGRTDSEFWKSITLTDFAHKMVGISKTRLIQPSDIPYGDGHPQAFQYNMILAGLGHITKETATQLLTESGKRNLAIEEWERWEEMCRKDIENSYSISDWIKEVDLKLIAELSDEFPHLTK